MATQNMPQAAPAHDAANQPLRVDAERGWAPTTMDPNAAQESSNPAAANAPPAYGQAPPAYAPPPATPPAGYSPPGQYQAPQQYQQPQTPQPHQQPQPPQPYQQPAPPARPAVPVTDRFPGLQAFGLSSMHVFALAGGLALLVLAGILNASAGSISVDTQSKADTVRSLSSAANFIGLIGTVLFAGSLMLAGLLARGADSTLRGAAVVAGAIVLGLAL